MVHGMNKCFEFNNGSASASAARVAVKSLRNGVLLPVSPYLSSSSNKEGSKKYSTLALPVTRSTAPRPALALRSVSEDDCFGRAGVANVLVLELLIGFTEEKSSEQWTVSSEPMGNKQWANKQWAMSNEHWAMSNERCVRACLLACLLVKQTFQTADVSCNSNLLSAGQIQFKYIDDVMMREWRRNELIQKGPSERNPPQSGDGRKLHGEKKWNAELT